MLSQSSWRYVCNLKFVIFFSSMSSLVSPIAICTYVNCNSFCVNFWFSKANNVGKDHHLPLQNCTQEWVPLVLDPPKSNLQVLKFFCFLTHIFLWMFDSSFLFANIGKVSLFPVFVCFSIIIWSPFTELTTLLLITTSNRCSESTW